MVMLTLMVSVQSFLLVTEIHQSESHYQLQLYCYLDM